MPVPRTAQPPVCSSDDALTLLSGDAVGRTAETGIAAQADFDKDQRTGMQADQIDFACLAPVVPGEGAVALAGEVGFSQSFSLLTAGLRIGTLAFDNVGCFVLLGLIVHEDCQECAVRYAVIICGGYAVGEFE